MKETQERLKLCLQTGPVNLRARMQLNLDYYPMTAEELEARRVKAMQEARVRAEEKKKYHGGDK